MRSAKSWTSLGLLLIINPVFAQQKVYEQCGGVNWTGSTTCESGTICVYQNDYYSQCLPGTATTTPPATTAVQTTPTTEPSTTVTQTATATAPVGTSKETIMYYTSPGTSFTTSLLLGNGRLGAAHYGGTTSDRWSLNEDSIWSGSPYDPANKNCLSKIGQARSYMNQQQWKTAQDFLDANCMAQPLSQTSYQPAGNLIITSSNLGTTSNYKRSLDLSTAVETTTFTSSNGVTYTRTSFVSYPDQVIVVRLSASSSGSITSGISLTTSQGNKKSSISSVGNGAYDYIMTASASAGPSPVPGGLTFENRMRVIVSGGSVSTTTASDPVINVSGANEALIVIAIASNFIDYKTLGANAASKNSATISALGTPSVLFSNLQSRHISSYQQLWSRFSIDVTENTAVSGLPLDQRLSNVSGGGGGDPGLYALYVNLGRYLLISSSRGGAQPANLQGIWNEDLYPLWGSKFTVNINTEMNYWGAQVANLADVTEALFRLVEDVAVTGARTAVEMYGTTSTATGTGGGPGKGAPWVLHHNTDQWRATAPIDGAFYGFWPTGGAWILQSLWEHYSYNPSNTTFVQRVYPLFRGASQFFLETLQQHPTNSGWLVTNPSLSPEHATPNGTSVTIGPHIDNALLRDLFDQTVQFATILNTDSSFISSVKSARAKLPPFQVGSAGQLQEWLWDWDNSAQKVFTHISHLYGLFPSAQIDPRLTSSLANASKISLQIRGNGSEGWPIAWRIGCWARLLDKGMAQTETNLLLSTNGVYTNLMGKNSIFQIDSNLGGMATILEMYLQSHNGQINLLPAVASSTPSGTITGIRARGGFTVALTWSNSALVSATIVSTGGVNPTVKYGSQTKTFSLASGASITITPSSFN